METAEDTKDHAIVYGAGSFFFNFSVSYYAPHTMA